MQTSDLQGLIILPIKGNQYQENFSKIISKSRTFYLNRKGTWARVSWRLSGFGGRGGEGAHGSQLKLFSAGDSTNCWHGAGALTRPTCICNELLRRTNTVCTRGVIIVVSGSAPLVLRGAGGKRVGPEKLGSAVGGICGSNEIYQASPSCRVG